MTSDDRRVYEGEIIPPSGYSTDVRLPDGVPLRIGILGSIRFWGVRRVLDSYRRALEAETAARRALADRALAEESFHRAVARVTPENLDLIRRTEDENIRREYESTVRARRDGDRVDELEAARHELEKLKIELATLQHKQRLDELSAPQAPGPPPAESDPVFRRFDRLKKYQDYQEHIEACRDELIRTRGGEANLSEADQSLLRNMEDTLLKWMDSEGER